METKAHSAPSKGARQLAEKMKARGLRDAAAAEALGCHYAYVSKMRRGIRRPGAALMVRIRKVFGIEPDSWFQREVS